MVRAYLPILLLDVIYTDGQPGPVPHGLDADLFHLLLVEFEQHLPGQTHRRQAAGEPAAELSLACEPDVPRHTHGSCGTLRRIGAGLPSAASCTLARSTSLYALDTRHVTIAYMILGRTGVRISQCVPSTLDTSVDGTGVTRPPVESGTAAASPF